MKPSEFDTLEIELENLANKWNESKYESAQASHVFAHPAAKEFGRRPEAIPYMIKHLNSDITWSIPLENALSATGIDLSEKIDTNLTADKTGNALQDKLAHLEGKRVAILKWARENNLSN